MQEIDVLKVMFHTQIVGRLTLGTNSNCLFQYDKNWLNNGFSISPLKLPLKGELFEADYLPFNGNFGVFEDSMPGGYAEYILQKELEKHGINYYALNPLQKLSIVGSNGMGALSYIPDNKITLPLENIDLDKIQDEALNVLSGKTEGNTAQLYVSSGNSGGVRPKILYEEDGRHWIIKFRHLTDPKHAGEIEFLYNQAAQEAGIIVPKFKLFNNKYFGEERFDIAADGKKIHMITASGLLHESITPPKMDYKSLLALTGFITQDSKEVAQQFRRMVFNYYAENFDDHARNFTFLYINGNWKLSPAYDMTHDSPLGQHATTVDFKSEPSDADFIAMGRTVQMSDEECLKIINEIKPIGLKLVKKIKTNDLSPF